MIETQTINSRILVALSETAHEIIKFPEKLTNTLIRNTCHANGSMGIDGLVGIIGVTAIASMSLVEGFNNCRSAVVLTGLLFGYTTLALLTQPSEKGSENDLVDRKAILHTAKKTFIAGNLVLIGTCLIQAIVDLTYSAIQK